ncbi:MAG: type III-A CRISPR-associated protein Cas10/Csm1, partial [Deltaproteobacteria bacterium]|nr:type III-A CRISPR-associated protein Cas10/Csm1 [Deltaproteobacteria bacterium]
MSVKRDGQSEALAALLHDIGKFKQRAGLDEDKGKTHVDIGYAWLVSQYGEGIVPAGARDHHGNERETWETNLGMIFYEADNCAASERKTSFNPCVDLEKRWHREIQLASVFSRIRDPAPEGGLRSADATFNILKPLDQWSEPVKAEGRNRQEDYRELWKGFEGEFESLRAFNNHQNVDAILHLLEKYTSYIPSITLKISGNSDEATYKKHPDVSLFDHLKVASAATACLADYHRHRYADRWESDILKREITGEETWGDGEQSFQLIGGDISGIQKFIYTISSKGALKALKGRSFFLELLTEHTVDRLIEEMELTRCNVIFTGGGHFYLLAPNTPDSERAVKIVREEVNEYLLEAFAGSLQLFIEAAPFGKRDFRDCSKVWGNLSSQLEDVKGSKWREKVDRLLCEPAMPHGNCLTRNCEVCGREDKPLVELSKDKPDVMVCGYCREQYWLGTLIQ